MAQSELGEGREDESNSQIQMLRRCRNFGSHHDMMLAQAHYLSLVT